MPKPAITNFSSVAVSPSVTNQNNGLYAPQLTQTQINKIPAATLKNGGIVYNLTLNAVRIYTNNAWATINTSNGDVKGPAVSVAGNIPTFADTTGKLIQDSGLNTTITLTGGVTGVGTIGAPLATTVAVVAPSAITGYPNTTSTFLRGDGTWTNSLTGNFIVGGTSTLGNITIAANTISTTAGSVNLGQSIYMNDNGLFLRNNTNYGMIYNAGIDGPQFRATGGFVWSNGIAGATELMRLTSSGNLGIRTTAPTIPLDVRVATIDQGDTVAAFGGATNQRIILIDEEAGAKGPALFFNSTDIATIGSNGNIGLMQVGNTGINDLTPASKLSVVGNAQIGFTAGGTAPANGLVVSGNVGIGTNNPTTKFQVVGTSTLGSITISSTNIISSLSGLAIGITSNIFMNDFGVYLRNDFNYGMIYNAGIDGPQFRATGGFTWNNGVAGATELMRLTSTGRLGIGTNNPSSALQVVGTSTLGNITIAANTISTTSGNVNLGQSIYMNDKGVFLRNDTNHGMLYDASTSVDGPIFRGFNAFSWRTGTAGANEIMALNNNRLKVDNLGALTQNNINVSQALWVNNDNTYKPYNGGYGYLNSSGAVGPGSGNPSVSVYCSQRVVASEFNAVSSKKIKNILASSLDIEKEAIDLFKKIPLFKYKYKDTISKGNAVVYGIVAEELAEVIPDYVRMEDEGWIPDIFQECSIKPITGVDKQYVLFFDKDLSKPEGDRLKIIIADGENEQHIELKILDYSLKSLIVSSPSTLPETAFVYGTYGTVPTVTKNNFFELGMVVLQNCLKRIENLEAKLNN